ncbi:MAG: hypothetical protein AAFN30_09605 [Actinomycetota bacterium]
MRLTPSTAVCALLTDDDLPGDEFRLVPDSSSVSPDIAGQAGQAFEWTPDAGIEEGLVPADASCSWIAGPGDSVSLMVLDYRSRPEILAAPADHLLIGLAQPEHPLLDLEGFDQLAVAGTPPFESAVGSAGPYVIQALVMLLSASDDEAGALMAQLFAAWLALARTSE